MARSFRNHLFILLSAVAFVMLLGVGVAQAEVPRALTHQGRLMAGSNPVEGTRSITFTLYVEGTDEMVHSEVIDVTFEAGYYTVRLGGSMERPLSEMVFGDRALELGITINADPSDPTSVPVELSPRQPITTVPYAFVSESVDGGTVRATQIEIIDGGGSSRVVVDGDGSWAGNPIPGSSIQPSAITDGHLGEEVVRTQHMRDGTVTSAKIKDGEVSSADIANNSIGSNHIADSAVSSADIQDGTVTRDDVKPMGGLYSRKTDLYERTASFGVFAGTSGAGSVACDDANDLPLTGYCVSSSGGRLQGSRALDWTTEGAAAKQECTFFNAEVVQISPEAHIVCVSVP